MLVLGKNSNIKRYFRIADEMLRDKVFLRKTLFIAGPIAMQSMINMLINLTDILMVGRLGGTAISSVGLANKVFFVFALLVFGIASGSGILSSQYYGNNDIKNIRKVLGLGLIIAVTAAMFFVFSCIFIPETLMSLFSSDENVVQLGVIYLSLVCISYPFTSITNLYTASLRAMQQVKLSIVVSIITICTNITLNYIFIFGHLGLPAMGVRGAATATIIARVLETFWTILGLYIIKHPLYCNIKDMFGYSKNLLRQFFDTSAPVIANEFMWGLGTTIYFTVYGHMGENSSTAITIANTVQDVIIVASHGLAGATVVMLGNALGEGNLNRAKLYSKYFHVLPIIIGIAIGIISISIRNYIIMFYDINDFVKTEVKLCLLVFGLYAPLRVMAMVNIVGILRSGGDTKMCFLLDVSSVWLVGIPLAYLGGYVLKLPIHLVYAMVMAEEIYKTILGFFRYRQYKWLRNLNVELNK